MLNIGNLKVRSKVILAPMAGITSLPFRMLNRSFGCALAYLEMINARSLYYGTKKTLLMMKACPDDRPLGVQLLADEEKYLARAIEKLQGYPHDLLDLNAACPQKKIIGRGAGAALLKDPGKLNILLKCAVKSSLLPVTAKIRLGWDDASKAADIARYAEDAGICALSVHGRTCRQGYSGEVDYRALAAIKKAVSIPVIASGDIFAPWLAKKMFDETGCDALMAARGALGNPWIFRDIKAYLENGREPVLPSLDEVTEVMRRHLGGNVSCFGEVDGVKKFRKFFIWYSKGFAGVKDLRNGIDKVKSEAGMGENIDLFLGRAVDWRESTGYFAPHFNLYK